MPRPLSQALTCYNSNVSIFMLFLSEGREAKDREPSNNMKLFLPQTPSHPPNEMSLIFIRTFPCIYNLPLFLKSLSTPLATTASSLLVKLNFNGSELISNVVLKVPENSNYDRLGFPSTFSVFIALFVAVVSNVAFGWPASPLLFLDPGLKSRPQQGIP